MEGSIVDLGAGQDELGIGAHRDPQRGVRVATFPSTEVTLTTRPRPRSRMAGTTARTIRIGPNTLVSNIFSSTSWGNVSSGPVSLMPALLTSPRPRRRDAGGHRGVTGDVERQHLGHVQVVERLHRRAVATTSWPRAVSGGGGADAAAGARHQDPHQAWPPGFPPARCPVRNATVRSHARAEAWA